MTKSVTMDTATNERVDIVVVGGGGSGLAAAIEVARYGRKVMLLEKNPQLGGTTIRSVGSITVTCTPLQRVKGIQDVPRAHFEDMALFADDRGFLDKDNLELRRLLVENSPDTVQWLMDLGVVFFGTMPEPPHRLPHMHNVLPQRAPIQGLDRSSRPIPGLYAAGSAGQGGLLLEGHGHHLGWAFTSGRLAGRSAALGHEAWPEAAIKARRAAA